MPPELTVFFGMIAAGKSLLAEAWAARSGAEYWNSDRVRKELAGLAATERCANGVDQGIYTPEFSRRTYDALLDRAAAALTSGRSVVLDASYQSVAERRSLQDLARRLGVRLRFVLCFCSEAETRRRLALRAADPAAVSDGRWEIYLAQKERFEPPDELPADMLVVLDTEDEPSRLLDRLAQLLA
ncbi:MAG TPA: hypothetical protein ENJ73_02010 [Desulfobacterales bacterium]|nr:hypothetical protein [Desulfobacterales bacterium]